MSKAAPKLSQRQKFKTIARNHGCDESEAVFDAALKKISSAKVARPEGKAKRSKASR